jgi:hypothetical protein
MGAGMRAAPLAIVLSFQGTSALREKQKRRFHAKAEADLARSWRFLVAMRQQLAEGRDWRLMDCIGS